MSHPVTPAQDPPPAPRARPRGPRVHGAKPCRGIPELPYAIRISEFGNPKSGTGVQEIFMVRYFPS